MKFLLVSNAPQIGTGYGVQAAHLATRLTRAGHEVAVACTYGQEGRIGEWTTPDGNKVRLYPRGYESNASNDVIHAHAHHFFAGDPLGGWVIPILDVWSLINPRLADLQVAAWAPVDHFPVPRDVAGFFHKTGATCLAMSRFGERMFLEAGLDPVYIPLSVDTSKYRPMFSVEVAGEQVDARKLFGLPAEAFVVGMVAMNKGWARDRKGFNEAFRAFGRFWKDHQDAVLFLHSEQFGAAEGINLVELAQHCAIPEHAIVWTDQYAYRLGFPPEMMAAAYTAMDVLLSPSHGEGFCVPLVEAQACGTPVIATDFSAQPELVGAGWLVDGQPEWDPAQHASYVVPLVSSVWARLEEAYRTLGVEGAAVEWGAKAVGFAAQYDADRVFDEFWVPFLASLDPVEVIADKPLMDRVDVIVPYVREANVDRLCDSFDEWNDGTCRLHVVQAWGKDPVRTYAENVNAGVVATSDATSADWVFVCGDDVEFTEGWFEAARKLSDRFDVIGTNDSEPGRVRNPDVAAGRHADHFFVRRSYIDDLGASLDGPGILMPECYGHWFVDKEVIGLAKARGVFAPCLESVVIHHHPGFDGDEAARAGDPIYAKAVDTAEADRKLFLSRAPLIEGHRTSRAKTR